MKKFIKNNFIYIVVLAILLIIGTIRMEYFKYNDIDMVELNNSKLKGICTTEEANKVDMCKNYLNNSSVKKSYDNLYIFYNQINTLPISILLILSVMIIATMALFKISKFFNSGIIKQFLIREDYKQLHKNMLKEGLKASIVLPIFFAFIFLLSCLYGNGFSMPLNSQISSFPIEYYQMGFNFFWVFEFSIWIYSLIYVFISLISARIVNNYYVNIIMSFLIFMAIEIISYIFLSIGVFNGILNIKLFDYFELFNFFSFYNVPNYLFYISIRIAILIILIIIYYCIYKNKEKFVNYLEKGGVLIK